MSPGRYWMRLSRFFMIEASWRTVLQEASCPRLVFMLDQAPSTGVEVRGVGGQPDDGQPVLVRLEQSTHRGADVRVQVVPDENERGMKRWCAAVTRAA